MMGCCCFVFMSRHSWDEESLCCVIMGKGIGIGGLG